MFSDTAAPDTTPVEQLLQICAGGALPRCLHAVANLGVADALDEAPQSAATLAAATGTNADALARALRLLVAHGVFEYRDGLFSHSEASRLLRSDHPRSLRPMVRMFGLPGFWQPISELEYSIRTGLPAADKVLPGGIWGYFAADSEASRIFDEAMTAKGHGQVAGVLACYDFSPFKVIGDIGGGRGHLLQAVLASVPGATGVLFDQAHVIEQASAVASDRLTLQAGDFFTDALPACDAYLVMEVIHNWDDERAHRILDAIRSASAPGARVLLIESIIADDSRPSWPKALDLMMLTVSGKQRSQQEYAALLSGAGFEFTREIDTHAGVSILEAVRG